jgi:transcriptional regulator with XRE-family HTH domain
MGDRGGPSGGNDLGSFLRARRAALDPRRAGLSDNGRPRRVPGLRREELSQLANVSIDYVVRLEQGRTRRVSRPVLDALADALQLTPDERAYLATLAEVASAVHPRRQAKPESPGRCSSYSTTCTTSPRWSSTGACTCWPGTEERPHC